MKNLIDEYFKRDLTEAEEQQLADWFSTHPEDTEQMAKGMADLYLKSGLPEPIWPGGKPPFGRSSWWVLKPLMPMILAFTVMGLGAYKWFCHLPAASQEPVSSSVAHSPKVSTDDQTIPVKSEKPAPKENVKTIQPVHDKTVEQPETSKKVEAPSAKNFTQSSSKAPSFIVPQPQGHVYQQLSVAVTQAMPGLVTVKVLDNLNTEVRTLFAGIMPEGNQTFTWDGKTDNGALAPAGTYFIEVKSGGNVQKKEIHIQGDGLP